LESDSVQAGLCALIQRYGPDVISEPKRLEALLRDYCPHNRREVNLLLTAVTEQVPAELRSSSLPPQLLYGRLVARLQDERGLTDAAAQWTVQTWAQALLPNANDFAAMVTPVPAKPEPAPITPPTPIRVDRPVVSMPQSGGVSQAATTLPSSTSIITLLRPYGMELIEIPAGEFIMGSNEYDDEKPIHTVFLDTYYIGKTLVTVKQYIAFCNATGHASPPAPRWGWKDDHPVVNVSWNDVVAYCEWLSKETGYTVVLPTEAQWEKAARGTDGRMYPWGNDWDGSKCANSLGVWRFLSLKGTMPVGSYPEGASFYGVLDMAGNVCQWCSDWYDANYYKSSPDRNPTGPAGGQYRVLRGGSWNYNVALNFRCAYRYRFTPVYWDFNHGFRCVAMPRP
jgi:formylglycine-generating enzyme required for sulfatase activity